MIFVTVGTDYHPFNRLVDWIEGWSATRDELLVFQYGACRQPRGMGGQAFFSSDQMREHFRTASAVVSAGGPGTIMSARREGCIPIVVPRSAALGEVVDDHQKAFAAMLGAKGLIEVADGAAALAALLDRAVADPEAFRFRPEQTPTAPGVAQVGAVIDDLLGEARGGRLHRRRRSGPS